ncbi:MAG: hypothetical protein ABSF92_13900 [Candidatus Acidiferrales bacterium]
MKDILAVKANPNEREMERRSKLNRKFRLKAQISSSNARAIQHALERLVPKGCTRRVGDEFILEAVMEGTNAKELNRTLLSALRRVEKKTTIRAEWTSPNITAQRFFDYVLKKTIKN